MTVGREARCKLNVDESRIWNMDMTNKKRLSYSVGYLYNEKHMLDFFKITDSKPASLQYLDPFKKLQFIRYYPLQTHKHSNKLDIFHSRIFKPNTALLHALDNMLINYPSKTERLFVPKFFHDRKDTNF